MRMFNLFAIVSALVAAPFVALASQPGQLIGMTNPPAAKSMTGMTNAGMTVPINGQDCAVSGITAANIWSSLFTQLSTCAGEPVIDSPKNSGVWQVVLSAPNTTFGYAESPATGTDLAAMLGLRQADGATLQVPSTSTTSVTGFDTTAPHTWTGPQTFGPTMETGRSFSGASDTPSPTDCGQPILSTGNVPVTVTLPAAMPANCYLQYTQWGSGPLAFTEATGASLTAPPNFMLADRKGASVLVGVAANPGGSSAQWNIYGWSAQ